VAHLLKSRLLEGLGVRHGFNLRTGGASQGAPYASFNLGRAVGDDPEQVQEYRVYERVYKRHLWYVGSRENGT